jgi:hypothetical protein
MDKKPAYYCSKCKMAVVVLPNQKPIKACKCVAPIHTNMEATVYAVSKMKA